MPDGANIVDGIGSSSVNGLPWPRIDLNITMIAANSTITTTTAKTIDSVPWTAVFLITSASWPGVFAEPKAVFPDALAAAYRKCCVQ